MKRVHVLRGYPAQAQNSRWIGDAPAEEAIDHHTKAWSVETSRAVGLSAISGTCGVWTATNFSGSQPVLRVSCSDHAAFLDKKAMELPNLTSNVKKPSPFRRS